MALLGWVPGTNETYTPFLPDEQQPRFIHNKSGRFESRWSTVTVKESPAIMLKVMSYTKIFGLIVLALPETSRVLDFQLLISIKTLWTS